MCIFNWKMDKTARVQLLNRTAEISRLLHVLSVVSIASALVTLNWEVCGLHRDCVRSGLKSWLPRTVTRRAVVLRAMRVARIASARARLPRVDFVYVRVDRPLTKRKARECSSRSGTLRLIFLKTEPAADFLLHPPHVLRSERYSFS